MQKIKQFIKEKAIQHIPDVNEKISWSMHAITKLRLEGLRKDAVEVCLRECDIIENYEMIGRPMPGCLVLGYINNQPAHVVLAVNDDFDQLFIITVYRPSSERWEDGWRTRKRKN